MVSTTLPTASTNGLVDQAAQSADQAIRSTQRATNHALDSLASGVQNLRHDAAPVMNRAAEQASTMAHRGLDAIRETSHRVTESVRHGSDSTVNYIKEEPVKAMLIAAGAGAALMALVYLLSRSRAHD